ncbi:MAG: tRNA (adenosine(37)-N6)-dimethylallyltransferase MiaA [Buchnera aphidicola (Kaburagia rhusicola ensigallis)]
MGPTACGKSAIAMKLKRLLPVELISVDSALIYREMDIGTDKPTNSELLCNPYHLINIKDPSEVYSVGAFQKDVLKVIKYVLSLGKIPLLVGGTMFYFKTLLEGLPRLPASNYDLRSYLYLTNKKNKTILYNKLRKIDPISSKRIHPHDLQRVLRALEIFYISGKTLTELTQLKNYIFPYKVVQFSIVPKDKNWLVDNIYARFKKMLLLGFQSEVERLLHRGDLNSELPSMRCVGYRQMWSYLTKNISYEEMVYTSIIATQKLAKNQLTWLKNWKSLHKLKSHNNSDVLSYKIVQILKNL